MATGWGSGGGLGGSATRQGIASRKLIQTMSWGRGPQGSRPHRRIDFPMPQKTHKESRRAAASGFCLPTKPRSNSAGGAGASVNQIAILDAVDLLVLQRFHKRLAGGVVPRVGFARHADLNAVVLQQTGVIRRGVLHA